MRNKLLVLSVVAAVALFGCSNEEGDTVSPNIDQQQTNAVAPQTQQQVVPPQQGQIQAQAPASANNIPQGQVQPSVVAPITGQPAEAAAPAAGTQAPVVPASSVAAHPVQEMQTALPVEQQNAASPMPTAAPAVQQSQLVEANGSAPAAPVAPAQPATPAGSAQ